MFAKNAIWDDFKLSQPTPDGFTIVKRTGPKNTWILDGVGRGTQLVDANELIWEFFEQHTLPSS